MTQEFGFKTTIEEEVNVEVRIYDAECGRCGALLDFKGRLDSDNDIRLTVDPCEVCLDKAKEE